MAMNRREQEVAEAKIAADRAAQREQAKIQAESARTAAATAAAAAQADAEVKKAEAAARMKMIESQARAQEAEANARAESTRAANDPKVLAAKGQAERDRLDAESRRNMMESVAQIAAQAGGTMVGLFAGHKIADGIKKANEANAAAKNDQLKGLAKDVKGVLAKGEKRLAGAFNALTKDPAGLAHVDMKKVDVVVKNMSGLERKALIGAVSSFDAGKLGKMKGPLGLGYAALLAADGLFARHMGNQAEDKARDNAVALRKQAADARAGGNAQLAEHLEKNAADGERMGGVKSMAWNAFGTANWFAGAGLLGVRSKQMGTAPVADASSVRLIETARQATGTDTKTVLQQRAVARLANNKTGMTGIAKALGLSAMAEAGPAMKGVTAAGGLVAEKVAHAPVAKIAALATAATLAAGAARMAWLHHTTSANGATQEGGPQNYKMLPGLAGTHKEKIVHKDGKVVTHIVSDQPAQQPQQ